MSGAGTGEREGRSSRRPSPLRATVPLQVAASLPPQGIGGTRGTFTHRYLVIRLRFRPANGHAGDPRPEDAVRILLPLKYYQCCFSKVSAQSDRHLYSGAAPWPQRWSGGHKVVMEGCWGWPVQEDVTEIWCHVQEEGRTELVEIGRVISDGCARVWKLSVAGQNGLFTLSSYNFVQVLQLSVVSQ